MINITLPLSKERIAKLRAGDSVNITGTILTARDCAHKRLFELLDKGEALPFDLKTSVIYYAGPFPDKPAKAS